MLLQIKNSDNIEVIPEKKEEEDESEEQRDKNINDQNILRKTSVVQLMEAKHLIKNNNDINQDNKINKDYINSFSQKLIKKTKKADKIMKGMKNNYNQKKLNEKIAIIKNEMPDIKTKYEIYLEEEKKNGGENDNEEKIDNKNNLESNVKVKDWWGGIFT